MINEIIICPDRKDRMDIDCGRCQVKGRAKLCEGFKSPGSLAIRQSEKGLGRQDRLRARGTPDGATGRRQE